MAAIIIVHIFYWRHVFLPIVVVFFLKLCDFQVLFLFGDWGHNEKKLPELVLGKICKLVDPLIVTPIKLFVVENIIVGLIKHKFTKYFLLRGISFCVISYILFILWKFLVLSRTMSSDSKKKHTQNQQYDDQKW